MWLPVGRGRLEAVEVGAATRTRRGKLAECLLQLIPGHLRGPVHLIGVVILVSNECLGRKGVERDKGVSRRLVKHHPASRRRRSEKTRAVPMCSATPCRHREVL